MLKGPEALDEFRQVIMSCISAGNSIKVFACEGPRRSRGSISTCGISQCSANLLPIWEKWLLKAEAIALESVITLLQTTVLEGELNPFGLRVIN